MRKTLIAQAVNILDLVLDSVAYFQEYINSLMVIMFYQNVDYVQ